MPNVEGDLPLAPIVLGENDLVQVVMLKPSFDSFQRDARARGLFLFPIPVGEDDLPTFGIGIGGNLWNRASPPEVKEE